MRVGSLRDELFLLAHDDGGKLLVAEPIIGDFFIHHTANRTLQCMKTYLETKGTNCAP